VTLRARWVTFRWLAYNAFRTNALVICRFVQEQRRSELLLHEQHKLGAALGHMSHNTQRLVADVGACHSV
jgi:hypothetical protein